MKVNSIDYQGKIDSQQSGQTGRIVEIEQHSLMQVVERISTQCRYPLLALRLLLHVITGMDAEGRIIISARHLSNKLDVNYDTVTRCLKFLREIEVLQIER